MPATHEELRELFVRHCAVDTFGWVEEILDRIDQRAEHHANEPRAAIEILRGDQSVDSVAPSSPWIYIVDGSLRAIGDLNFGTEPYRQSLLCVLGDVEARHFMFNSGAACFIKGDLRLRGDCFGHHGDEAAELYCQTLHARSLILDHVTGVHAVTIEAVVSSVEGWGLPMHVDYGDKSKHAAIFAAEALKDGSLSVEEAWAIAHAGRDIFLPGVVETLVAPPVEDRTKPQ